MDNMMCKRFVRWTGIAWVAVAVVVAAAPEPPEDAGKIAVLTAKLFEQAHFNHHRLDDEVSVRFLAKYIESLDYNRMFFTQTDLKEFEVYRTTLDDKTLAGDVQPAFQIFKRYEQRIEQAVVLVKELLQQKFDFTTNESIVVDRSKAAWPADDAEAKTLWQQRVKYELLQEELNKKKPADAIRLIDRRYERLLRSVHEMDGDDVLEAYLNSLCHTYDPHSDYFGKSELKNFEIGMKLSLFGIGAKLRSEDGFVKVDSLIAGGPADKDGRLKPNDRIVAVADENKEPVDVVDMKLNKVVELIRGTKDTKVQLTVIPADAADESVRKLIVITRDEVKLADQHAKAKVIELDGGLAPRRIGVIDLPSFYADTDKEHADDANRVSTTRDVATLLEKLKAEHVSGIVLDLRKNGGGLLDEAVALAGLFIKQGPVVQVKDTKNRIQVLEDDDTDVAYDGPLAVLVSHVSASASEIFAAAMQDYGRAIIVGDSKTFGKGTVQTMVPLAPWLFGDAKAGALKLTTQKFYRVAGGSTQNRGVIPDIVLPSIYDAREIGESSLDNAMPYDEVDPAEHDQLARTAALLPDLKQHSSERIATKRDFAYLKDDIARLSQQVKDGKVSLNKAERLQEKKANDDRKEERKKERASRNAPEPKVTEVLLQPAAQSASAITASKKPAASAKPTGLPDDDEDHAADDTPPPVDPTLSESVAILSDFINTSAGAPAKTVSTTAPVR